MRENKGKSLILFPMNYIVFDIETTGLNSAFNEIIEISAIKVRNDKVVDEFSMLVKPQGKIGSFITNLTGITNEMVSDAPSIDKVLIDFLEFIEDDILIGHNVNFDINFVYDNMVRLGYGTLNNDFVDNLRIARKVLTELDHHRLGDLAEYYLIDSTGAHRGLKDSYMTYEIFLKLKEAVINKYGSLESFLNIVNGKNKVSVKC